MPHEASVGQPRPNGSHKPRPPKVRGVPLLGNALGLARDPVQFWVDCAREYGPAFRVDYPTAPKGGLTVLAGRSANRLATAHGQELFTTRQYYSKLTRETGTDNYIAALDGEKHKHFRSMIKPALSREALAPFVSRIFTHVEALAQSWKRDQRIPVMDSLQRVTVDALSMAAAGVAMTDKEYEALGTYASTFVGSGVAGRPAIMFRLPAYKKAKRAIEGFLERQLERHRKVPPGAEREVDLMDFVLAARYPNGEPYNLADQIANAHLPYANGFIYAGRISAYAVYSLLRSPAVLERVMQEIDGVCADGGPTSRDISTMRQLHWALREVHRRYQIAPAVPRYAIKSFEFEGYHIEQGSYIFIATAVPHFDPDYFAEPYEFQPDRFTPPRSEHLQRDVYSPFGLGTHVCLSIGLVEQVVKTALTALLRTVELEVDPPDYELESTVDPVPGPDRAFSVRVLAQRQAPVLVRPPQRDENLAEVLSGLDLGPDALERLVGGIVRHTYEPGATVIREGDPADRFFIITSGTAEAIQEESGEALSQMGPGDYFGEIGLLLGVPRTATVRATPSGEPLEVLSLNKELFDHFVSEFDLTSEEMAGIARLRIVRSELAQALPGIGVEALERIGGRVEALRFEPGETIVREGEEADRFFVLVKGSAEVLNESPAGEEIFLRRLEAGDFFGEIGILNESPRTATVRVVGHRPLEVLALRRQDFLEFIGGIDDSTTVAERIRQRLLLLARGSPTILP